MNVASIVPKGEKAALIILEDKTGVWTPDITKAQELEVGKPIPESWTQKQGEYGPQAFPPRQGKANAPAAFRNTKEGFESEQASIHRSVALQRAIEYAAAAGFDVNKSYIFAVADEFYEWLESKVAVIPPQTATNERGDPERAAGAGGAQGLTSPAPAADCLHLHTTDDKPEGGKYKLGWAWCLDCRTPVKVKA